MAVGCGAKCSKLILFVINVFVWISSIILIGIGGYVLNNSSKYENLFGEGSNTLTAVCGIIIGVGCFIFLVGFLGCCGAIVENKVFLGIYFAILLILVIVEFVGGILAFVYKSNIQDYIQENLERELVELYGKDNQNAITTAIDDLQMNEACCGVHNYTDYDGSYFRENNPTLKVPKSCCTAKFRDSKGICNGLNADLKMIHTKGCMKKLTDFVNDNLVYIGVSALVLLLVQITAMVMSCCLIAGIGKDSYQSYA